MPTSKKPTQDSIGARLGLAMAARPGLSQRALERASGLNESYVSRVLRNAWEPSAEALRRLARALDVSYTWLAIGEGEPGFMNFKETHPVGHGMIETLLASHEISSDTAHVLREQARSNPCDFHRNTWETLALQTEAKLRSLPPRAHVVSPALPVSSAQQSPVSPSPPVKINTAPTSAGGSAPRPSRKVDSASQGPRSTKASAAPDAAPYRAWIPDAAPQRRTQSGIELRAAAPGEDPLAATAMFPFELVPEVDEAVAAGEDIGSESPTDSDGPEKVDPTFKSEPSKPKPRGR